MQVQQGPGWRFGLDPSRVGFPVLLGGEGWAVELTAEEARGLQEAVMRLVAEWGAIADQLMAEESITLELERGPIWVELEGTARAVALRFVLQPEAGGRGVEGSWPIEASQALVAVWAQDPWAGGGSPTAAPQG
ncbi:MAG: DUF1818 family protein [Cyanobacteria bacterium]|nr:DUF1818 family protein [Cyanobacteriota bacterium]